VFLKRLLVTAGILTLVGVVASNVCRFYASCAFHALGAHRLFEICSSLDAVRFEVDIHHLRGYITCICLSPELA
jgi:hypothetical protein